MAYGGFKDLLRRTACDKILRDRAFDVAKNPKYDIYCFTEVLLQWFINFLIKYSLVILPKMKIFLTSN